MAVVSFVFAVLWAVALKDIVPMTKQKFNGYSDFREKVECPFFADSLPESAEKAKYYQHSGWLKKHADIRQFYHMRITVNGRRILKNGIVYTTLMLLLSFISIQAMIKRAYIHSSLRKMS